MIRKLLSSRKFYDRHPTITLPTRFHLGCFAHGDLQRIALEEGMNLLFPKLKRCPFCGEVAVFDRVGFNGLEIKCLGCPAKMIQRVQKFSLQWLAEKMSENWNLRESNYSKVSNSSKEGVNG